MKTPPMLAVSNTSPISNLACIGRLDLLRAQFGGIWLPRAERKRFHQPRHRREHLGELIQIDGCEHRWFEDRGPPCTLLVFVDDATSRLMALGFVPSRAHLRTSRCCSAIWRRTANLWLSIPISTRSFGWPRWRRQEAVA